MDSTTILNSPSVLDVKKLCLEEGSELTLMALQVIPVFQLPKEAEIALMLGVKRILEFQRALAEIKLSLPAKDFKILMEHIAKAHKVKKVTI